MVHQTHFPYQESIRVSHIEECHGYPSQEHPFMTGVSFFFPEKEAPLLGMIQIMFRNTVYIFSERYPRFLYFRYQSMENISLRKEQFQSHEKSENIPGDQLFSNPSS